MIYSTYQEVLLITSLSCEWLYRTSQLVVSGCGVGAGCERVKGGFSLSLHTGMLIVRGLKGGDGSECGMCVSVDCSHKTCVR